jgi:uncharacterized protein with GYD domain
MPTYIALANWTDEGIRNVRQTIERCTAFEKHIGEKYGVSTEHVYWTIGPYDFVLIAEVPDDESATAALLEVGSAGTIRTTTLRAYDREEMSRIIERLGPAPGG